MRLKKIKLAGFKSFVDPISITFDSDLMAIVGPNGCGKSNVIDAVRWVLGGSARYLRGETLSDVIFNGSVERKPVGQATAELIFDNSDGAIGGEYASYSEIAIKRVVTRDDQSSYFLNGARCRRRDVTDLFLGTGLGPRSYAIIEQGMIAQLIEAKPEELRLMLEEAAGISKYKERRRETGNRIKHTRDNLLRVDDIRDELAQQLKHLQKQAHAAEKYQELRQQETTLQAQLAALRWCAYERQLQQQSLLIKQQETVLEQHVSAQRKAEKELEQQRQTQTEMNERRQVIQADYYHSGQEIVKLEQQIQHQREREQQLRQDLQQAQAEQTAQLARYQQDQDHCIDLEKQADALQGEQGAAQTELVRSQETLSQIEQTMADWQQQWGSFQQASADSAQQALIAQTRNQHLQQRLTDIDSHIVRLHAEASSLDTSQINEEIKALALEQQTLAQKKSDGKEILSGLDLDLIQQREHKQQLSQQLDLEKGELQNLQARHTSLVTLQQAALAEQDEGVIEWIARHQVKDNERLAQVLKVEPGWELAVEMVLGKDLQGLCINEVSDFIDKVAQLPAGELTLIDTVGNESGESSKSGNLLLSKIKNVKPALSALLHNVYVADSLVQAQQMLAALPSVSSVVTRDGLWLGQHWLRIMRTQDNEQGGVIRREQALRELTSEISDRKTAQASLIAALAAAERDLKAVEDKYNHQREIMADLTMELVDIKAQLSHKQDKLADMQQRSQTVKQTLSEQEQQRLQVTEELTVIQTSMEEARQAVAQNELRSQTLQQTRSQIDQQFTAAKHQLDAHRDSAHAVSIKLQAVTTQLHSLRQALARDQEQLNQLQQRCQEITHNLAKIDNPQSDLNAQLQQKLTQQQAIAGKLSCVQNEITTLEHAQAELEQQRQQIVEQVGQVQNQLQTLNLEQQTLRVRMTTIEEDFVKEAGQLQEVAAQLPEDADEQTWAQNLQNIDNRIKRLGAINLAAIEECQTANERKTYLDEQHQDLSEALATLEKAIDKIDKETVSRFQQTFEQVNMNLGNLFPHLFGGGKAYLALTDDNILTSGVTVMARPPGKKNHSIHMLSGGEKALVALSVVFAIFQLNPAPFCMLDEVDAPLDDSNVRRFCDLVKEMSHTVQFIMITHNKVSMELAQHLTGVTMRESGVSRLVSVDVEKAVALAQA